MRRKWFCGHSRGSYICTTHSSPHSTPNWHLEALGGGFRDAVKALLGQRVEQTEALKDGNALRIVVRNRRPLMHGREPSEPVS